MMKWLTIGLLLSYSCLCNAAPPADKFVHQHAHAANPGVAARPHQNYHPGYAHHEHRNFGQVVVTTPFYVPGIYTAPNYYNNANTQANGYYDTDGNEYYIDSTGRAYYLDQNGVPYYLDPNGNAYQIDANGNAVYVNE